MNHEHSFLDACTYDAYVPLLYITPLHQQLNVREIKSKIKLVDYHGSPGSFAAAALASDMYPSGHFQRVSELTADTFDGVVKREVDAGRTLFVRWIASPK